MPPRLFDADKFTRGCATIDSSSAYGFSFVPTQRRESSRVGPVRYYEQGATRTGERREWERRRRSVPLRQIQVFVGRLRRFHIGSSNCISVICDARRLSREGIVEIAAGRVLLSPSRFHFVVSSLRACSFTRSEKESFRRARTMIAKDRKARRRHRATLIAR